MFSKRKVKYKNIIAANMQHLNIIMTSQRHRNDVEKTPCSNSVDPDQLASSEAN